MVRPNGGPSAVAPWIARVLLWAAPMVGAPWPGAVAQDLAEIHEDFQEPRWNHRWQTQPLGSWLTVYRVAKDGDNRALYARSDQSASAVTRRVALTPAPTDTVSWRWKIEEGMWDNARERRRDGDDFAARVFLVFGRDLTDSDTKALCYVWAANEPVGTMFPNPFVGSVQTIVLRSGRTLAGTWQTEARGVWSDYRRAFGESPGELGAVAIMVDSDNTRGRAAAWFDDLSVASNHPRQ